MGLKEARDKRDTARADIVNGIDPNKRRRAGKVKLAKAADTLEVIAREWHDSKIPTWAPMHAKRVLQRLQADIFTYLATGPLNR